MDAKIITRGRRVYFRKHCPEHGTIEDFVCSDVAYYDRHEFSRPARLPLPPWLLWSNTATRRSYSQAGRAWSR